MDPVAVFTATKLDPIAANHSRLGDVLTSITTDGNVTTSLEPGDTLNLLFNAPPPVSGEEREYFLFSNGVYTSNLPAKQLGNQGPPTHFALLQNQPNPFARGTLIRFELPQPERVRLEIFDLQGRRVSTLVDAPYQAGRWSAEWDRRDTDGNRMPAGVYLYRMTSTGFDGQRKMVLLP